jgi:hypothetical protein
MKNTHLLNSIFFIPARDIVKNFCAFFRFTERDACTLLSAYGLHALEVNRLQNDRPNERKETEGSLAQITHRKRPGEPPRPIPIGVHLDFARAHRITASRKHVDQCNPENPGTSLQSPYERRVCDR